MMASGREWHHKIADLVVMKYVVEGKNAAAIAKDLNRHADGPRERSVRRTLERWEAGTKLTARRRRRRNDVTLRGHSLMRFRRVILNDPTSSLDELRRGCGLLEGREMSGKTLCRTLQVLGLTRRRLHTIHYNFMEWKRVLFWRHYNIMYSVEMLLFTDEMVVIKDDAMRRYECNVTSLMSIFVKRNVHHRGTNTKQRFERFVRQVVVPQLRPYPQAHSVVVMDRASIHFYPDIIELIEHRGARVFGIAPYCPWENPTEYLHSWIQQHWDERVSILRAVRQATSSLPPNYAVNTIRHCGY